VRNDRGFTLIELLVALSLAAILLTISATALHSFWLVQSLDGAADAVTTQLRQVQGQVTSESHPLAYAVSFSPDASGPTASAQHVTVWKYNTTNNNCTNVGSLELTNGTYVRSASFASSPLVSTSGCTPVPDGSVFGFFFARGTATATTGSHIVIRQDSISYARVIKVIGLTGRVQRT
jgi:prepilin-type N-terminal cleavage/methylation domain-containing protein